MVSQNLHSVYLQRNNPELRELQSLADCVRVDGIPLVWFSRLSGLPITKDHRTGWMDWMGAFMGAAQEEGWRIFYVGSKEEVMEEALSRLRQRFPRLQIAGVGGYFDADRESSDSLSVIQAAHGWNADILLVGMGMPRQERWMYQHLDRIEVPVLLTCGAAMDYVAGAQATPPRWMGPIGLEWLYRLMLNPRRMWFRYLVEPWYAVALYVRSLIGRRTDD